MSTTVTVVSGNRSTWYAAPAADVRRAVTLLLDSRTGSSTVLTVSVARVLPAAKVTLVGGVPLIMAPLSVTDTATSRLGAPLSCPARVDRVSRNRASSPSTTVYRTTSMEITGRQSTQTSSRWWQFAGSLERGQSVSLVSVPAHCSSSIHIGTSVPAMLKGFVEWVPTEGWPS